MSATSQADAAYEPAHRARRAAWWQRALDGLAQDHPLPPTSIGWLALVVLVTVAAVAVLPQSVAARVGLAVVCAAVLVVVCARSSVQGLFALTGWLALLGLSRRLVSTFQADPSNDPLLLVAPTALGVLVLASLVRGSWRDLSWMAWGVVAFSAVMLVAVVNPQQGSPLAGLGGLLFWLVPLLWFWVGRVTDTVVMWRLLAFVAGLAVVAGTYGVTQAVIGFTPWDQLWLDERGYRALEVSGPDTLRQFGFSASAGEYAQTLSIGILLCSLFAARALSHRPRRWIGALVPLAGLAVLAPALALASVRTAVALTAVAFVVVFVAQRRWGFLRASVATVVAGGAFILALRQIDTDQLVDRGVQGMVRRTVRGLADPFGEASTLGAHGDIIQMGLEQGWRRPLGTGTSAATLAGPRLGDVRLGTETDISNGAIAFGLAGIALVAYLSVAAFVTAWRVVARVPGLVALATLGTLVVSFRFWFNGAHYAPAALVWLLLGWADVAVRERQPAPSPAHLEGDPLRAGEEAVPGDDPFHSGPVPPT